MLLTNVEEQERTLNLYFTRSVREREKTRTRKRLILKDRSIRSIWTSLTASPCYKRQTDRQTETKRGRGRTVLREVYARLQPVLDTITNLNCGVRLVIVGQRLRERERVVPPLMSSLRLDWLVEVSLCVHRNRRLIRDGSPGQPPRRSHSS